MEIRTTRGKRRMHIDGIRAVVFDYGNTLIEFSARQAAACDADLGTAMERLYGACDRALLRRIREADRWAPYAGDPPAYRENDLPAITRQAVERLYGRAPSPAELEDLLRVRFDAFLRATEAPPETREVLGRLASRYRLALLSNYPDSRAIRESLRRTRLAEFLDPVLISADLGRVKPHPFLFTKMEEALGLPPTAIVYVGDNWLADVQGARRAGWRSVWVTRWNPPENPPRHAGDLDPHATIGSLAELPGLLGV